jgi:hypothetical protein
MDVSRTGFAPSETGAARLFDDEQLGNLQQNFCSSLHSVYGIETFGERGTFYNMPFARVKCLEEALRKRS